MRDTYPFFGSTCAYTGVTRERLEGFDRAITLQPEFSGNKKDALIHDFRNYLGILKAVHSGADLQASASAAGNKCVLFIQHSFSGGLHRYVEHAVMRSDHFSRPPHTRDGRA